MPDNFDPTTIEDPLLRQIVIFLLNRDEKQATQIGVSHPTGHFCTYRIFGQIFDEVRGSVEKAPGSKLFLAQLNMAEITIS